MIHISIKSDFMDVKRQFTTDKSAEKYLKTVKRLHDIFRCGKIIDSHLKVEITNTEATQLPLSPTILNETRI